MLLRNFLGRRRLTGEAAASLADTHRTVDYAINDTTYMRMYINAVYIFHQFMWRCHQKCLLVSMQM